MYLEGLSSGVTRDVKAIRSGTFKKDDEEIDSGTPAFLKDNDIQEEDTDNTKQEEAPAFGA
jgi:hypothetical protein